MRAVIFLWQPDDAAVRDLGLVDIAIAADSGMLTAASWGVKPDAVVGDFDSVDVNAIDADVEMHPYPRDKDFTDFELAAKLAVDRGATKVTVVGSTHGRADHGLAVMLGLAGPGLDSVAVDAWIDDSYAVVVRSQVSLSAAQGARVSLIPLFGDVSGVTTSGLRFPLTNATLVAGSALSISNEMTADGAGVSLESGVLLTLQSSL